MEMELKGVIVYTSQYKVEGQIKVPVTSYRGRLSDYLNQSQLAFFPVVNPTISLLSGEIVTSFPEAIMVNKANIIMVHELVK